MAVLQSAATVAIAVTAWCLLLAHAVNASRHCNYMKLNFSSDSKPGSFCRRVVESTLFQSCCSEEVELSMWNTTINDYNNALLTLSRSKLDSVDTYLNYLIGDHLLELADKVQSIPHLLATTGKYGKEGDFWNDTASYKVDALFRRLVKNNATLQDLSIGMMEHAESVIRFLIDEQILQRTAKQQVLELMRSVLFEWISQKDDEIVYSLFQEKDIAGQRFIVTLIRYNRLIVALRSMEKFWQVASQNAVFPTRVDPKGLDSADTMTQCLLNFMNLTKCPYCFIATKDMHFCPHVFTNQTTCLAAFLHPAEQNYATLISYFRAIFVDYSLLYADAAHQFTIRHLVNIKRLVNQRWFEIIKLAVNQFASRQRFSGNQEAQARAYLNTLANKTFELFTMEELTEPEPIPVAQQVTTPLISKTAKFVDTPGQFSILTPLHESARVL